MIDRVVQRPFLLWQAELMASAEPGDLVNPLPEGEPPSAEEIAAAQAAVREAVRIELKQPLTPAPDLEDEEGGGKQAPPIEWRAFVPRDPRLSLVQSATELYLREFAPGGAVVPTSAGDAIARGDKVDPVANFTLAIADDEIPTEAVEQFRLFGPNEYTDPGWIGSAVAMGWRWLKGRQPFPEAPAEPRQLARDARLVVVGDWASGNERAENVAAEMRVAVEAARDEGREVHVVHLGDTYYGGWDHEYRENFLPFWPVHPGEEDAIGSWSLPGNHDMHTGGHGYYRVLLEDDRFRPYHQGSSRFSLENEDWQLLGLDTAWKDHELKGDQAQWVEDKLAANPGRRTMLLSHHQPFSSYKKGSGQKLRQDLAKPLAERRIDSWLWGHEHRCVVYEPREIQAPRCIGHGGIPEYTPAPRPSDVRWHLDRSFRVGLESWVYFGFAILDFDGPSIAVEYVNERGETDWSETI